MSAIDDGRVIDDALVFYRQSVEWLESHHVQYAETATIDLDAEERPAAIWKLAGQSIGLTHSLVDLLERGYTGQTWPTMRAIHEVNRLLGAVADVDEEDILRRWLADQEVKQSDARKAEQRQSERIAEQMKAVGLEPLEVDVAELSRTIYRGMSKAAHHRRSIVEEGFDRDARSMVYGPDPRTERQLEFVIVAAALTEEVLLKVGDALCVLWGPGFYFEHLVPMLRRFHEFVEAIDIIDHARRFGL